MDIKRGINMNLGISNTVFRGTITVTDKFGIQKKIDTNDITGFGINEKGDLYIDEEHECTPQNRDSKVTHYISTGNNPNRALDSFSKTYEIASRQDNLNITLPVAKHPTLEVKHGASVSPSSNPRLLAEPRQDLV